MVRIPHSEQEQYYSRFQPEYGPHLPATPERIPAVGRPPGTSYIDNQMSNPAARQALEIARARGQTQAQSSGVAGLGNSGQRKPVPGSQPTVGSLPRPQAKESRKPDAAIAQQARLEAEQYLASLGLDPTLFNSSPALDKPAPLPHASPSAVVPAATTIESPNQPLDPPTTQVNPALTTAQQQVESLEIPLATEVISSGFTPDLEPQRKTRKRAGAKTAGRKNPSRPESVSENVAEAIIESTASKSSQNLAESYSAPVEVSMAIPSRSHERPVQGVAPPGGKAPARPNPVSSNSFDAAASDLENRINQLNETIQELRSSNVAGLGAASEIPVSPGIPGRGQNLLGKAAQVIREHPTPTILGLGALAALGYFATRPSESESINTRI